MESKIKVLGHPVHPMLVVFPLGLLATAVIFDILYLTLDSTTFSTAAFWMIAAGVVGGLLAAIFGFADWLSIPDGTRAKRIGLIHGLGNLAVTLLFAISLFIRRGADDYIPGGSAMVFSFAGVLLALFTAWLGGEMVYRLAMGVDKGANLDAVSSLSGEPASVKEQQARPGMEQGIPVTGHAEEFPNDKPEQ